MSTVAILSSNYQIAIPKSIREEQHWQVGQKFVFIPKGNGLFLIPVTSFEALQGIAKGSDVTGVRDRGDRF